jgi:hypothetical protein
VAAKKVKTVTVVDEWSERIRKVVNMKALGRVTDLRQVREGVAERAIFEAVTGLVRTLEKKSNQVPKKAR